MVGEIKKEVVIRQLAILIVAYFISKKFLKLNTPLSILVSVLAVNSSNYFIGRGKVNNQEI